MRVFRQEIRTGVLVIVTIGILVAVLLLLGAPGVFSPLVTYRIFFDNAGGIKLGGPVMLAGRKIGQVTRLISPVKVADRPANFKEDETLVVVEVAKSAEVYREVTVRMEQSSLLGDVLIDFTSGVETSGRAPNGSYFIGERERGFGESIADAVILLKQQIIPVAQEATKTMESLRETSVNLQRFTAAGSNMDKAIERFRDFGDNMVQMTKPDSQLLNSIKSLHASLDNINKLTGDLVKNDQLKVTLENFQSAADNIQKVSGNLDRIVMRLGPSMEGIANNARDFTNVIKRQPWRLIWHSTVSYPGDAPAPPDQAPAPRKRRVRSEE